CDRRFFGGPPLAVATDEARRGSGGTQEMSETNRGTVLLGVGCVIAILAGCQGAASTSVAVQSAGRFVLTFGDPAETGCPQLAPRRASFEPSRAFTGCADGCECIVTTRDDCHNPDIPCRAEVLLRETCATHTMQCAAEFSSDTEGWGGCYG